MSLVAKEINRRRHIRWRIELRVMLVMPCSDPVPCTIYDFCSSGMFLELEQADDGILLHQHLRRQGEVCFSVGEKSGKNDFQFDVEIMRICSNGVGVAFQNIPMSAFQALVNQANLTSVPVSLVNLDHFPDRVKMKQFEKTFKSLLGKCLPMILKEFFRQVDNELIKISKQAGSHTEKNLYSNAFAKLKSNQKKIVTKFCNSLLKEIRYIDNSISEGKVNSFNNEDKLSAVNKDEISDWIDLSSIIRRTQSKYENQLSTLEKKLSHVTGIPANQINNPVTPSKLFYSFRAAIEYPDENNEVMNAFYTIFGDVLVSQLDKLYGQFDSVLIDQGTPEQVDRNNTRQSDKLPKNDNSLNQQGLNRDQPVKQSTAQHIPEENQKLFLEKV